MEVKLEKFSESDLKILSVLDINKINKYIDCLMDTKEIMWNHGDTGKLYPKSKLPRSSKQCLPVYREELNDMGEYFSDLRDVARCNLYKEGFFNGESEHLIELGTMYSPVLIVSLISDAYSRECFHDGLFSFGIENRLYLKLLLHLKDCFIQFKYIK